MHAPQAERHSNHLEPTPAAAAWSPQQQTARMLALCEAQMEAATHDSDEAVDVLVNAFTELMGAVRELSTASTRDNAQHDATLREINMRCTAVSQQVASAIVAFQFYDKLSQRLGHVRYSLSTMALFICDRAHSQQPEHWEKLIQNLGRLYRTAEERAIFDSIAGTLTLSGSDLEQPLSKELSEAGSIEMF